jgi:DNA-binding transcriptional LysR family regulator
MASFNLRRIDLNLLKIFEVLYEEKNQRKASERLFITQPAVSAALTRLREIVHDKLFLATSRGLTSTLKADELYKAVHASFGLIRNQLDYSGEFSPAECQRVFTVAIDYGSGAALALPLFNKLRAFAPKARLQIQTISEESTRLEMLKSGGLDLSICQFRTLESDIESSPFSLHQGVFIARKGHPRISQAPDFEAMTREEFVLVYGQPMAYENSELDALVACIRDRIALEVPSAAVIPHIVKGTDLVSIMSRLTLSALDCSGGLLICDLPTKQERATAYAHWCVEADLASSWFRELVLEELRSLSNDRLA